MLNMSAKTFWLVIYTVPWSCHLSETCSVETYLSNLCQTHSFVWGALNRPCLQIFSLRMIIFGEISFSNNSAENIGQGVRCFRKLKSWKSDFSHFIDFGHFPIKISIEAEKLLRGPSN